MSVRTLWNWEHGAGQPDSRSGRPPHSPAAHARAQELVAGASATVGSTTGWRPYESLLALPRRLLEPAVKAVKAAHRAHVRAVRATHRVQRIVRTAGTIVGQDSAHLGVAAEHGVWAEVWRDWATLWLDAGGDGQPATEESVLEGLEVLRREDRLPLVLAMDNGSAYWTPEVEARLAAYEVVHLGNRPHVPQDNAATERGIGEAKPEAGLGRGVLLATAQAGVAMLQAACGLLNARPRPSRGDLSADELTRVLPSWETRVARSVFYRAAQAAIQRAVSEGMTKRQRRQAEREAVFETLEVFGLLSRVRGGEVLQALRPEIVS